MTRGGCDKKLAYSKMVTGNEELFVKNLGDGTTRRLTTSASEDYWPSWSPDGSRIAFTSRRSGTLQIWTMGATGGSPLRLTHTAGTELYPQWSH
jgi:Tol biopolymer transport system component